MSLLDRIKEREKEVQEAQRPESAVVKEVKEQVLNKFYEEFHGEAPSGAKQIRATITKIVKQICPPALSPSVKNKIFDELLDELLGLGPLEPLFREDGVEHIVVKDAEHIFVKKGEDWDLTEHHFRDADQLQHVAEQIFASLEQALVRGDFASKMSTGTLRFLPLTLPFSFDAWSQSGKIGRATAAFLQSEAVAPPPEEFEQFMNLQSTTTFNVGLYLLFRT